MPSEAQLAPSVAAWLTGVMALSLSSITQWAPEAVLHAKRTTSTRLAR